jgi:hypothetical protein
VVSDVTPAGPAHDAGVRISDFVLVSGGVVMLGGYGMYVRACMFGERNCCLVVLLTRCFIVL